MADPYSWLPRPRDVGSYVPTRTVPVDVPGEQDPLNTFSDATTPTEAQVNQIIVSAGDYVAANVGTVDPALYGLASAVTAIRAAGLVELAYPIRDGEVNTAEQLLEQAKLGLASLVDANSATGVTPPSGGSVSVPVWSFPEPVPNFDSYPTY